MLETSPPLKILRTARWQKHQRWCVCSTVLFRSVFSYQWRFLNFLKCFVCICFPLKWDWLTRTCVADNDYFLCKIIDMMKVGATDLWFTLCCGCAWNCTEKRKRGWGFACSRLFMAKQSDVRASPVLIVFQEDLCCVKRETRWRLGCPRVYCLAVGIRIGSCFAFGKELGFFRDPIHNRLL